MGHSVPVYMEQELGSHCWQYVIIILGRCWTPPGLPFVTDSVQTFYRQNFKGVRFGFPRIQITSLLFGDDVVLLVSLSCAFQPALGQFAPMCEAAVMRIRTFKLRPWFLPEKGWIACSRLGMICCPNWRSSKYLRVCSYVGEKQSRRLAGGLVQHLPHALE